MKIDFSELVVDLRGRPIKDEASGGDVTLYIVATNALLMTYPDEQGLSGIEKQKRYKLAIKIDNGPVDLNVEQVAELKKLIGKAYPPLVVGRSYELLDPVEEEEKASGV